MIKFTRPQAYFYFVLSVSIIWFLLSPKPSRNYAPIIFMIPTFPYFMLNYYSKLIEFSIKLKLSRPDLFEKYVVDYGIYFKGEIVDIGLIKRNDDFENLDHMELHEIYILCRQSMKWGIISFITFPIFGIVTILV